MDQRPSLTWPQLTNSITNSTQIDSPNKDYKIDVSTDGCLGRGAFGVVYRCCRIKDPYLAAVKVSSVMHKSSWVEASV